MLLLTAPVCEVINRKLGSFVLSLQKQRDIEPLLSLLTVSTLFHVRTRRKQPKLAGAKTKHQQRLKCPAKTEQTASISTASPMHSARHFPKVLMYSGICLSGEVIRLASSGPVSIFLITLCLVIPPLPDFLPGRRHAYCFT